MKTINLNVDKSKKYVVACSFGPDSMALLDSAIKNKLQIVVAHVNYRKRDAAIFEQESLQKYCESKKVKCYVLDLIGEKPTGNFQDWARKRRYKFFNEVCQKEGAEAVLVAHQQDDVIETYLMQKKRGNIVKNAGISGKNELFGIEIERPLLGYTKQELKDYDDENGIPYSIDESNLSDHYTRNKIRHSVVEKLTKKERDSLIKEIDNQKKIEVEPKTILGKEEFLNYSYEEVVWLLDFFMNKLNEHRDLSSKFVEEIKKAFNSKDNIKFKITPSLSLELDYGNVYLVNLKKVKSYQHKFANKFKNEFLNIDFSEGAKDRNIPPDIKSFVVRNLDKNARIIIKDYHCKISRLFIDWKMPHYLREVWPAIYSENGQILYIPRYRKEFVDNHKSKLEFNTKYFTEF